MLEFKRSYTDLDGRHRLTTLLEKQCFEIDMYGNFFSPIYLQDSTQEMNSLLPFAVPLIFFRPSWRHNPMKDKAEVQHPSPRIKYS